MKHERDSRNISLPEFQARFPQGPDGTYGCDTISNPHYTTWGNILEVMRAVGSTLLFAVVPKPPDQILLSPEPKVCGVWVLLRHETAGASGTGWAELDVPPVQ